MLRGHYQVISNLFVMIFHRGKTDMTGKSWLQLYIWMHELM